MAPRWTTAATRAALLLLACAAALPAPAAASDASAPEPPPLAEPSLLLGVEGLRDRYRDGGVTLREGALSLRGSLPFLERRRVDRERRTFSAWSLSAQAEARAVAMDLPAVDGAGRFLRLGAGLSGTWLPSVSDSFWLSLGAFVAEQEALLGEAQLHPRILAVGTHRASDTLRLLYGFGYTYAFGRGLPLPFLGLSWRMAPAWRLDAFLPVVVRAAWAASDALSVDFGTAVAGEQFRYRTVNPASPSEPGPHELLHVVRLRLGAGCTWARLARRPPRRRRRRRGLADRHGPLHPHRRRRLPHRVPAPGRPGTRGALPRSPLN
jgi:hypothetical protein